MKGSRDWSTKLGWRPPLTGVYLLPKCWKPQSLVAILEARCIALCGYEGEHKLPLSWECVPWKATGGYGSQRGDQAYQNAARERIWFSPHCLRPQENLFANLDTDRCDTEIAAIEGLLRAGHPDVDGLCRGLIDWETERRLIEEETA